jgi:uncharacterized RDD family membrane protein YckC
MLDESLQTSGFDIESTRPAGFWIRVAASLIDLLVLLVFIVGALFMKSVAGYILLFLPTLFYKPLMEGLLGGTAGKLALGLKVVNRDGELLGVSGGFVRAGIFIVNSIPNVILQIKMIQLGISSFDPVATQEFREVNELLVYASYAFSAIALGSCIMVAFTAHKRGLHDMMAESFVIYKDNSPSAE